MFRIWTVPLIGGADAERELNSFLANHRIINVKSEVVVQSGVVYWTFCIEYLESQVPKNRLGAKSPMKPGKDYMALLGEAGYAIYDQLRDLRKSIAQERGVPLYEIASNAQLAGMIQQSVRTKSELSRIPGFGQARIEEFGARFVEVLSRYLGTADASSQESVPPSE